MNDRQTFESHTTAAAQTDAESVRPDRSPAERLFALAPWPWKLYPMLSATDPAFIRAANGMTVARDIPHLEVAEALFALAASAVSEPEPETAWLVERGQSENHAPTVWWVAGVAWTMDANEARRFSSEKEAHEQVVRLSAHISQPLARATEHVFLRRAVSEGPAEATEADSANTTEIRGAGEALGGCAHDFGMLGACVKCGADEYVTPRCPGCGARAAVEYAPGEARGWAVEAGPVYGCFRHEEPVYLWSLEGAA